MKRSTKRIVAVGSGNKGSSAVPQTLRLTLPEKENLKFQENYNSQENGNFEKKFKFSTKFKI